MPNPVFTNPLLVMVSRLIKSSLALLLCIGVVGLQNPVELLANAPEVCNSICVQREYRKAIKRRLFQERTGQVPSKSRREPAILRVRGLTGSVSVPSVSVTNTSFSLLWNAWGLGQSDFSYTETGSGKTYTLTSITNDLSYTFGKGWFYTLGLGLPTGGSGSLTTSTGTYQSSKFGGSSFSGLLGTGWGGIEGWLGYKAITLQYTDFQKDGTLLGKPFAVSLGLLVFGIGGSF